MATFPKHGEKFLLSICLATINTFSFSQQKDDLSAGKYVEINAFNDLSGIDKNINGNYEKV